MDEFHFDVQEMFDNENRLGKKNYKAEHCLDSMPSLNWMKVESIGMFS